MKDLRKALRKPEAMDPPIRLPVSSGLICALRADPPVIDVESWEVEDVDMLGE